MKIKAKSSTLSCITKCIRFALIMINKKIIFGLLVFSVLGACTSPSAMLGPAYTLSSSGSVFQAGFSYGSNQLITTYTGKTPIENLKDVTFQEENIEKQTLESNDFYILVKNRIEKTNSILNLPSQ